MPDPRLSPPDPALLAGLSPYQIGLKLGRFAGLAELPPKSVALLSVGEGWASVRRAWYELAANFPEKQVFDLGNIIGGNDALAEVLSTLRQRRVFALVLGSCWPMAAPDQRTALIHNRFNHLQQPELAGLLRQASPLVALAHQTFGCNPETLQTIEYQHGALLRLGQLRAQIEEVEPLLRECHWLGLTLSALRAADAPAAEIAEPNGLAAEDACRLVRYAALGEWLEGIFLGGFAPMVEDRGQTARLLAQLAWFAVDGFFGRKGDYPLRPAALQRYVVETKETDLPILFFRSPRSERWWVAASEQARFAPCSYRDYLQACEGHCTERVLDAISW